MVREIPGFQKWALDFASRFEVAEESIDLQNVRDYVTSFLTFDLDGVSADEHKAVASLPFDDEDLWSSSKMLSYVITAEKILGSLIFRFFFAVGLAKTTRSEFATLAYRPTTPPVLINSTP